MSHEITAQGVTLAGVTQNRPVLLQMNTEDFPARFFTTLSGSGPAPGSTVTAIQTSATSAVTLYQPVQRVVHTALLAVSCNTVGSPALDPARVQSAGIVIRRVIQNQGVNQMDSPPSAWMTSTNGQRRWAAINKLQERLDPDPTLRPQLQSGQPELDRLLALQTISSAFTESYTPAFVAPPAVCEAAGRTLVYGVIPTASSEISTNAPTVPQYDPAMLAGSLPTLLQAGSHPATMPDKQIDYRFLSDDYATAHGADSLFPTFSLTLRLLYSSIGAFDSTPKAQALIAELNSHGVYFLTGQNTLSRSPMGSFYQLAASTLIDYDTPGGQPGPPLTMPHLWDSFTSADESKILSAIAGLLQSRSAQVSAPTGRYQDSTRLYRARVFLRLKATAPGCPSQIVWSEFSDPFRIAAWYESAGRMLSPVPLPDPTDRNFLRNAKPNSAFAVPAGLMNAMQGSSLSGLSSGTASASGNGAQLNWICGFNIPLITICAFFILNMFLSLLNIVFFWLPFVKTCIPLPTPTPANSGDTNGT